MKPFYLVLFLLLGCSDPKEQSSKFEPDDDYVLVEFASRLEEDYHRIQHVPESPTSDNKQNHHNQHQD